MGKRKYDWEEVQKSYDDGLSGRELIAKYGMSFAAIDKAVKRGEFKYRCRSIALSLSHKNHPRKHSEETKKKLSKIRKDYLEAHPDKVPYLLNHFSRGDSYPEKYFEKAFANEDLFFVKKMQVGLYELDFCDPNKKIDIEIDGDQHYLDTRIIESDLRRTRWLEERGWSVIRIRWSDFQKMSKENRFVVIQKIKNQVSDGSSDFVLDLRDYQNPKVPSGKCQICQKDVFNTKYCSPKCQGVGCRKSQRPTKDILEELIKTMPWTKIGEKYNVSCNAVRKWAKDYELSTKSYPRGYWQKKYAQDSKALR